MTKKKSGGFHGFKRFLAIYSGILVVVVTIMLFLLYGLLKDYEEGRPATTMDKIVGQFTADNVEQLLNDSGASYNEFESNEVVATYLKDQMSAGDITYKKKAGEYTENTPVYVVFANEKAIAKVSLASNGKNGHDFTKWKLGGISFDGCTDKTKSDKVVINAPKEAKVQINGIDVSSDYITKENVTFEPCKHVDPYVTAPTMTEYTIEGLLAQPQVSVVLQDNELTVDVKNNIYTANYPYDDTLFVEQQKRILTIAESYGKYIINRGSLPTLSGYMVGQAKEYVSDIPAIWAFLYGKTYTYEFKNESITNLRKYSDDCFSCDIYYDLYVDWNNGNKTYNTSLTYTFVKRSNGWYVADFIIN
jgi:hypothetical protein